MGEFWNVRNSTTDNGVGELLLMGDIEDTAWFEDDVTPKQIIDELEELGDIDKLEIKINSRGGSVWAGHTIYALIQEYADKNSVELEGHVLGLAASIASVIAAQVPKLVMYPSAMLMIHNPWLGPVVGDANDFLEYAETLDSIRESLIIAYKNKTGLPRNQIIEMMDEETWLTSEEAVAIGLADEVKDNVNAAASLRGNNLVMNGTKFNLNKGIAPPKDKIEEINFRNEPRSTPRNPSYDDTEKSDWGDIDKSFSSYIEAYYEFTDTTEPDELPSSVDEASSDAISWIAKRTILGNSSADTLDDLLVLPVVSPDTNNLNRNGLQSAVQLAPQLDSVSEEVAQKAQEKCQELLENEFSEENNKGVNNSMFKEFESKADFKQYLEDNNYTKAQSIFDALEEKIGFEFDSVEDVVDAFAEVKDKIDEKEEEIKGLKAEKVFSERKQELENVGVEVSDEDKEDIVAMTDKQFNMLVESNKEKMSALKKSNDKFSFNPNDFGSDEDIDDEDVAKSLF